jgi:Fe2+ transport system protein FeoA
MPLASAVTGQVVRLASVSGGRGLQLRLAEMGLVPGVRFRVIARGAPGPFIISVKDTRMVLGHGMAHRVRVHPT